MRYMGGKWRLRKPIANLISIAADRSGFTRYLEPFCGGLSVSVAVNELRVFDTLDLSDANRSVIAMWRAIQRGWKPPTEVPEALYHECKTGQHKEHLRGFVLTACSFGGKFEGGYARNRIGYNYAAGGCRAVLRRADALKCARLTHCDYRRHAPKRRVVYCDPPYAKTTAYKATPPMDHEEFWRVASNWSERNVVLVSEYEAPSDWTEIWRKTRKVGLKHGVNAGARGAAAIDRLFVHESRASLFSIGDDDNGRIPVDRMQESLSPMFSAKSARLREECSDDE